MKNGKMITAEERKIVLDQLTLDGFHIEVKDGVEYCTQHGSCVFIQLDLSFAENRMKEANREGRFVRVQVYGGPILCGESNDIGIQLPTSSIEVQQELRKRGIEVWKAYLDFGDGLTLRIV